MNVCPRCESNGPKIKPATLLAQVVAEQLDGITDHDGWRLCTSGSCEVVYFQKESVVTLGETNAIPFHKSADPDRLTCFCFEHTVADIKADFEMNESSTIQASIKTKCKAGQDDCIRKNPQGRCCLGNVGYVLKQKSKETGELRTATESCCGPTSEDAGDQRQ